MRYRNNYSYSKENSKVNPSTADFGGFGYEFCVDLGFFFWSLLPFFKHRTAATTVKTIK